SAESRLKEREQRWACNSLGRHLSQPQRRDFLQEGCGTEHLEVEDFPADAGIAESCNRTSQVAVHHSVVGKSLRDILSESTSGLLAVVVELLFEVFAEFHRC